MADTEVVKANLSRPTQRTTIWPFCDWHQSELLIDSQKKIATNQNNHVRTLFGVVTPVAVLLRE